MRQRRRGVQGRNEAFAALLSREQVDADRVIKEQIGGMLTQEISCLFRKQGIGNDEGRRES